MVTISSLTSKAKMRAPSLAIGQTALRTPSASTFMPRAVAHTPRRDVPERASLLLVDAKLTLVRRNVAREQYLPASATESGRIGTPASVETVRRVARGGPARALRGAVAARRRRRRRDTAILEFAIAWDARRVVVVRRRTPQRIVSHRSALHHHLVPVPTHRQAQPRHRRRHRHRRARRARPAPSREAAAQVRPHGLLLPDEGPRRLGDRILRAAGGGSRTSRNSVRDCWRRWRLR